MRKKLLLIITFSVLLVACTNVEQEAYENHLMQAKNKINIEEFEEAQALLIEAVSIEYGSTKLIKAIGTLSPT